MLSTSTTSTIVFLVVAKDNIKDAPMSEEFIPNSEIYSAPPSDPAPTQSRRDRILITIIGSATGLDLVVKILHRLGFAEARAWSKPQIDPHTGRPMRILTKWLRY
jgi:hypothetical protein